MFKFKSFSEAHSHELAELIAVNTAKSIRCHGELTRGLEVVEFCMLVIRTFKKATHQLKLWVWCRQSTDLMPQPLGAVISDSVIQPVEVPAINR